MTFSAAPMTICWAPAYAASDHEAIFDHGPVTSDLVEQGRAMVGQVVRFEGDDGRFMLVELAWSPAAEPSDVELVAAEHEGAVAAARLEDSLESVRGAASALLRTVDDLDRRASRVKLDEISLELALSFAVAGGVIVAKGSAQAAATVTLSWKAPSGR